MKLFIENQTKMTLFESLNEDSTWDWFGEQLCICSFKCG